MGTKDRPEKSNKTLIWFIILGFIALIASTGYGIYKIVQMEQSMKVQKVIMDGQKRKLDSQGSLIDQKDKDIKRLEAVIEKTVIKQGKKYEQQLRKKDNELKEKKIELDKKDLKIKQLMAKKEKKAKIQNLAAPPSNKKEGKTLRMKATAYTASCYGCSGTTYTGLDLKKNPHSKIIAVDPAVIPLGTKVYVEGYGYAVAEDIGGGINGMEIDVFIPETQDAYKFGVKQVDVTILN